MPGKTPHHTESFRSCVKDLVDQGKEESSAYAICTASFQKADKPIFEAAEAVAEQAATLVQLHLRGATGHVRTAMYDGREHVVVPVVALMEGVIHAVNASTPEFVPLTTLQKAAATWNGRPVVLGHPVKDGRQCSANSPEIHASHAIGTIFNSRVEGRRLLQEAWIDVAKAKKLHPGLTARLLAGDPEEVSVGAWVLTDPAPGTFQGRPYQASWIETTGDHLAFLPGGRGACSMAMGCGAHRAASYLVTAAAFEEIPAEFPLEALTQIDTYLAAAVIPQACVMCEGTGSKDGNPCEACNGEGEIRAAAGARHSESDRKMIQQVHDHAMALGAECDRQNYKTLAAPSPTPALRAACACQEEKPPMAGTLTKEKRAEIIAALVTDKYSGFKEGDEPFLETATDGRLEEFRTAADTRKADADEHAKLQTEQRNGSARLKVAEEKLKVLEDRQPTEDEFLASPAGATLRTLVAEKKAQDAEERDGLIKTLKAVGANTEEELQAMENAQLRTLAKYAKVQPPDYRGRGIPVQRVGTKDDDMDFTPPNPYEAGLKALQEQRKH